jgi:hypothetical protein
MNGQIKPLKLIEWSEENWKWRRLEIENGMRLGLTRLDAERRCNREMPLARRQPGST